ncbi:sugar transferase, PEP-CTERM/EpsH1 system associated [Fusobacterium necrogenes]|uniref:Sugar transferase, PEP-CTERM/EpsH1 system associated n=1 Tax=Fusobacterium necrogenes TaxID=858 RepID=A0A377GVQ1_9FUSO|nr:glycosyltransferase [Fusobacterium necrogenes]STO30822.1 sugar transferase, PEP-CTERM/EpsH1 system associated [Fusobacterium necrogenes]
MKNILYISSTNPEYSNGGAIGTKKIIGILEELERNEKIKWYGIINKEIKNQNKGKYLLEIERNKKKALLSRILGYSEQLELASKKILKAIKEKNINIVILQNSRLGSISEKIKKNFPKIKIIQNFDNFEYEFSTMFTKNMNKTIQVIEKYNVKKSEKKALQNMDYGIFLTEKDKKSVEEFYKIKCKKYKIIPIIYNNIFTEEKYIKKKKQVIFTGSLDMEANIEAGLFLVENYKKILEKKRLKLVLAGRNPNNRLIKKIKELKIETKIELIANPTKEEMEILLRESLIYISPVFEGSGMKTKVIEALFYGLPIIASEHSVIGYNNLEKKYVKVFKNRNIEELNTFIEELLEEKNEINFEKNIREYFKENFSTKKVFKEIEEIIDNV